jgi:hypothetical protein
MNLIRASVGHAAILTIAAVSALAQVSITTAQYEGAEHFVVRTPAATYWYDRAGGGFSRLLDPDGRDWIAFRREPWNQTPASSASSYRGIPNFAFGSADSGAGHPGFSNCVSVQAGNSIITTSRSGNYRWIWTFFEDHARVTVERAGPAGYWFLYEGTPGGSYAPNNWYWGHDRQGPIREMPDFLKGERATGAFRWVYFGDDRSPRVLLLAQHESDTIDDSFGVMGNTREGLASPDGMVVFGFGRGKAAKPLLTEAPRTFTLGFVAQKITSVAAHATLGQIADKWLAPSPLSIRLWYGPVQYFGRLGVPQRWVNVLGQVDGPAQRLTYSLNGGPAQPLSLGPNETRLAAPGDFNVEIDYRALRSGANTVDLVAESSSGQRVQQRVVVDFTPNRFWTLPYEIDWKDVKAISDVAQIVDGDWILTPEGVRTRRPYYDRVLAIGDLNWQDYEATVEVTFHGFAEPKPGPPTYNVSHAGIGLRWQGHQEDGLQPRVQWYPVGAANEFQLFPDLTRSHWRILLGPDLGRTAYSRQRVPLELNRKYILRARVERQPEGRSRYSVKIWADGEPEPAEWAVETLKGAGGLQHGSLLLVSHNTDVTFGRVRITAPEKLPPLPAPFREPARKARLGELHYSSLIGGTVGARGEKFACELISANGAILSAQAGLTPEPGSVIQALRFEVAEPSGTRATRTCGVAEEARWQTPFVIPPGRRLIGLSGATGWLVDNLRFHLDDGTTSPLYGNAAGGDTAFQLLLRRNLQGGWAGHLRGFWGSADTALESLGLLFWPLEAPPRQ